MRTIRIALAYLAAAALGAIILLLSIQVVEGFGDLVGSLIFLGLGFCFATVFTAPIALPAIIYSELRGVSDWRFFAMTGALSGLLIYIVIGEIPPRLEDLPEAGTVVGASVIAASTYWWLAGRMAGQTHAARIEIPEQRA